MRTVMSAGFLLLDWMLQSITTHTVQRFDILTPLHNLVYVCRLKQLPADAVHVIRECLAVDPQRRATAAQLQRMPFFEDVEVPPVLAQQLQAAEVRAAVKAKLDWGVPRSCELDMPRSSLQVVHKPSMRFAWCAAGSKVHDCC